MSSANPHERLRSEGEFDRVIIEGPSGRLTTLSGDLPYRVNGFHWQFVTPQVERVIKREGHTTRATIAGDTVTKGTIRSISYDDEGLTNVYVEPPPKR